MRGCLLIFRLDLLHFVLVEYLLLIPQYLQCLLMLGIILHDCIFCGTVMHLFYWIADSSRYIIQLLQCFIVRPPLYRLRFGIDSQVDDSIGSLSQFLHLLIPVVQ